MEKWFGVGDLSKNHIIPFLVPFFYLVIIYVPKDKIINNKKKKEDNNNIKDYYKEYQLTYFIIIFLSKTFSGFLYIISKFVINKTEIPSPLFSLRITRRYHLNINSKNKIKILFYIMIISVLEFIYNIEHIRTLQVHSLIEMKLGFTIFVPFFSSFILRTKYYRHHFVSMIIGFIGFLFVILSFSFANKEEKHSVKEHLGHSLFSIPYSFSMVLINYLFRHYFINPFAFLFFDGIFILLFAIFYILLENIGDNLLINNLKNILLVFKNWITFLLFVCILLCSFIYYVSWTITLYLFTPTILVMTDILSPIFRWIIEALISIISDKDINKTQSILKAIGYCFLYIACILFNEIIICHFCKLDYNTYQQIKKRGIEDVLGNNNSVLSSNESLLSTS